MFVFVLARELYGQSSGRIRSLVNNVDTLKIRTDLTKLYQSPRQRDQSPTFIQSRRYHVDQPLLFQSPSASSVQHAHLGTGIRPGATNQEGCRLMNNYCSHDHQCCSGKCRCVRWSVMGKMSCWKKCF